MNRHRFTFRCFLSIAFCSVSLTCRSSALIIDPLGVKITDDPGNVVEGDISLTNEKSEPTTVSIFTKNRSARGKEFPDWLRIDPAEMHLDPGEMGTLHYIVTIPEGLTGELISLLRFSENAHSREVMLGMRTMVSIHMVAVARGTEIYSAEILDIELKADDPLVLNVVVENTGNVYVHPQGECAIVNAETDERIARFPVNENPVAVHVGRPTTLATRMEQELAPGTYRVTVSLRLPDKDHVISKTKELVVP